jgi:4-amino-4-deoxy-L-arabinose transferase-like glycosyltransferase
MSDQTVSSEPGPSKWRLWAIPTSVNGLLLAIFFYCSSPGERVPSRDASMSVIIGLACTLIISLPLCVVADECRKRLGWSKWVICPAMACLGVFFAFLFWLLLPAAKNGFHSVHDILYYGLCIIFAPSATFGIFFTFLTHDHKNGVA